MSSFNKVILMGRLTRDPDIRQAGTGVKVADLGLAVSETWRDKNSGQAKEVTCFVDVVAWDRLADFCGQYLTKGQPVLVEGRLQMDEWKTQQGEKRTKMRVRADTIRFAGPKPTGAGPTPQAAATGADAPPAGVAAEEPVGDLAHDDEQLPF